MASVYSAVAARSDLSMPQTAALQLLFDINFVLQCMVASGSTEIAQVSSFDDVFLSIYLPIKLSEWHYALTTENNGETGKIRDEN